VGGGLEDVAVGVAVGVLSKDPRRWFVFSPIGFAGDTKAFVPKAASPNEIAIIGRRNHLGTANAPANTVNAANHNSDNSNLSWGNKRTVS
jgi:hypothetical protein